MSSFCVLRRFRDEDHQAVKEIITEATMEQVGNFFWSAILSEVLPQISVIFIAFIYIFVGIPLKYCLMAIPLVIILLYFFIWLGHYIKANELNTDLDNIQDNYMKDILTCFYVAEVYGKAGEELALHINKMRKVEYDFYTEKEFQVKSLNINGLSKTIVGTIGITRSLKHSKRAWIRRMAVKKEYRRRTVATQLLREAIKFCEDKKFDAVDLITTECHSEAKQLYTHEGFKETEVTYKSYLGIGASQMLYHMYRPIEVSQQHIDNKEESLMEENL